MNYNIQDKWIIWTHSFTNKNWNIETFKKNKSNFKGRWKIFTNKKNLNLKNLKKFNPKFIFFPNLNIQINKNIVDSYNCICFHETDLPYGRGGSPIQNMIIQDKK